MECHKGFERRSFDLLGGAIIPFLGDDKESISMSDPALPTQYGMWLSLPM